MLPGSTASWSATGHSLYDELTVDERKDFDRSLERLRQFQYDWDAAPSGTDRQSVISSPVREIRNEVCASFEGLGNIGLDTHVLPLEWEYDYSLDAVRVLVPLHTVLAWALADLQPPVLQAPRGYLCTFKLCKSVMMNPPYANPASFRRCAMPARCATTPNMSSHYRHTSQAHGYACSSQPA